MSRETNQDVSVILVGNKNDMKYARVVTYEEGRNLASRYGISFM
jgi:GTPase SAR1 family protein